MGPAPRFRSVRATGDPRPGGRRDDATAPTEPDEPPLAARDPTGALRAWIDVGAPDAAWLHRRMTFDLSVTDGQLYVTIGGDTLVGEVVRHPLVDR